MLTDMPQTQTFFRLDKNAMMVSHETEADQINGADFFIESDEQPEMIAQKCERHAGLKFKLTNVSNRGTQVWPTGSVYTNLVNQYNARFESIGDMALNQQDIIGLYASLSGDFKVCSLELLNKWGDKKAYSLAQGQ
jgi:isocitrate dehydrogenase